MNHVFNFVPLLLWMFGFYALHLCTAAGAQVMKDRASAVFAFWLLGTVLFLFVGVWITARSLS